MSDFKIIKQRRKPKKIKNIESNDHLELIRYQSIGQEIYPEKKKGKKKLKIKIRGRNELALYCPYFRSCRSITSNTHRNVRNRSQQRK